MRGDEMVDEVVVAPSHYSARPYLGRTNFNGFVGDGGGAYSRLDRPIRIDTAGGPTIRIAWIEDTLLALSTMRSQAANFLS
jgi:hypothetical protein